MPLTHQAYQQPCLGEIGARIWQREPVPLQEENVIRKYGFLYGGYSFRYWEVADMIRKLAIAAIPVFIKPQPTGSLQGVLGEIVLVLYVFVISYLKPFGAAEDNLLQVGSMIGKHRGSFPQLLLVSSTVKSLIVMAMTDLRPSLIEQLPAKGEYS